jgi:hypothetical protein
VAASAFCGCFSLLWLLQPSVAASAFCGCFIPLPLFRCFSLLWLLQPSALSLSLSIIFFFDKENII